MQSEPKSNRIISEAGCSIQSEGAEGGQALLESLMVLGLIVVIAILINDLLAPVVLEAFQSIAKYLSSVGP